MRANRECGDHSVGVRIFEQEKDAGFGAAVSDLTDHFNAPYLRRSDINQNDIRSQFSGFSEAVQSIFCYTDHFSCWIFAHYCEDESSPNLDALNEQEPQSTICLTTRCIRHFVATQAGQCDSDTLEVQCRCTRATRHSRVATL